MGSGRVESVAVKECAMEGCMDEWKALRWKRKDVWVEKGSRGCKAMCIK